MIMSNALHQPSPASWQADSGGKKPDTPTAEAGADAPASSGPSEEQLASLFAEFAELAGSANCAALRDFHAEILSCQAAAGKQPDGRPAVPDPISLDVADADKASFSVAMDLICPICRPTPDADSSSR